MKQPASRLVITISLMTFLSGTLAGCHLFQPKAHFFIINESLDKQAVDFRLTFGGQTVFNDSLRFNNVRPDLRYTPNLTMPKGKYTIEVNADAGRVQKQQTIMLDGDRFIFVTYHYKKAIDSEPMIKKFGFAYSPMQNGQEPGVEIYVTDKEPVHM